jgi:NAD(P)-dependent dehydrogenase (short-subunit alcohol dehydrogenase family)
MNQGSPELNSTTLSASLVPSRVAVTGATGRTGSLVVQELLARNISVVAMVRSMDKAQEVLVSAPTKSDRLTICSVDLTSQSQVQEVLEGCDAVVWCATGFSDAPQSSWLQMIKRLLGMALAPKQQSIDVVGLPLVAQAMLNQRRPAIGPSADQNKLPLVVMLSSAGVTRLSWTDAKKKKLEGCADIPIVRLNPFGILNIKAESEQALRESGK